MLLTGFLRFFFFLIYQPLAFLYDWVAAAVSFGQWKPWVLHTENFLPADPVLELGHGPGHLQVKLRSSGRPVFGLDASRQMGSQAYRRLKRAGCEPLLARSLAQRLPFPDNTFAGVTATFPSEYIFSPETADEIARVLHPDGRLVVLLGAFITGRSLLQRITALLYRLTGQGIPRPEALERAASRLKEFHLNGRFEWEQVGAARLLFLLAEPEADNRERLAGGFQGLDR